MKLSVLKSSIMPNVGRAAAVGALAVAAAVTVSPAAHANGYSARTNG